MIISRVFYFQGSSSADWLHLCIPIRTSAVNGPLSFSGNISSGDSGPVWWPVFFQQSYKPHPTQVFSLLQIIRLLLRIGLGGFILEFT